MDHFSQKNFRVARTPQIADTGLSKFLPINWKTNLQKFLQHFEISAKKGQKFSITRSPEQKICSGHLRSKIVDSPEISEISVGSPLPTIFWSFFEVKFWEKST